MSMRSTRKPACNNGGTCSAHMPPSDASECVMQTTGAFSGPTRSYAIERSFSGNSMIVLPVLRQSSAGFHRQGWILGPFRQRRVVQLHVTMAQHDQRKRISTRGDAATTVVDHLAVHRAH